MKITVAPDSFKGSLSAADFCRIAKECAEKSNKNIELCSLPSADGGEGTLEIFAAFSGAKRESVTVKGPHGKDTAASVVFLDGGKTAVIECAEAIGLNLAGENRNPAVTSSYGVGQMISYATGKGAHKIILALGGSSTNDCGTGMLSAMGVRFTDICGNILEPVGASLHRIETIDYKEAFEKYRGVNFTVMTDVDNPLLGERGCAAVFSPQKGADAKCVKSLEDGAARYANIVKRVMCEDHSNDKGAGAAGGIGFAAAAFLRAKLQSGADTVLDLVGFDKEAAGSDLVITGEGCFDSQSLMGKAVGAVLRRSGNTPVTVICGKNKCPDTSAYPALKSIIEISSGQSEEYAMSHTEENLRKALSEYFSEI